MCILNGVKIFKRKSPPTNLIDLFQGTPEDVAKKLEELVEKPSSKAKKPPPSVPLYKGVTL